MDKHATIKDLKVNVSKPLTGDSRRAIVKVLEDEFDNQRTVFEATRQEKEREVLEQYKKKVKFTVMRKKYDKAMLMATEAEKEMQNVGLDKDGCIERYYGSNALAMKKAEELRDMVEKVAKAYTKPRSYKNKIISRIWMADTMGEACVIMNEVMGNDVIPTITPSQLQITQQ